MDFLDRYEERSRLTRLLDSPQGEFACVYGRRRCGKTRLLTELVAGRDGAVYFLADRSEKLLQISSLKAELARKVPVFAGFEVLEWGKLFDLWRELAPRGSILILDEFPYLVKNAPELPSVIQRTVDLSRGTGKKIIICGSSQRMMQGFVLSASEPLYGRAREIIKVAPLEFDWLEKAFPGTSFADRLRLWSVYGGVPRYWELAQNNPDVLSGIRENIMNPLGVLYDEPQFLLLDEVGDLTKASSVLAVIGAGANRVSEIAARLGRNATELSHPLKRLVELGLIRRDTPFGTDESNTKKSLYRIADQFLDFWYTFALPNKSRPHYLEKEADVEEFQKGFSVFLGRTWERMVRSSLADEWRNVARWWGTGLDRKPMELDVVGESADGKILLVGETKLSAGALDVGRIESELRRKAEALPFRKNYAEIQVKIYVALDGDTKACGLLTTSH